MQIIEVTGFGVRSAVIRLRRRESPMQVVIYPMIHMASAGFYAEVTRRLATAHVIVAEGIRRGASGRRSALTSALTLSYTLLRFNRRVRLVEQDIDFGALGVPVLNPDIDADEFRSSWRRIPLIQRLVVWSILPVVMLGRLLGGARALWTSALEVYDLPSDEDEVLAAYSPELEQALGGERDDRLVAALCQLHEQRSSEHIEVAVVYGAAHVPVLVHRLRDLYGYRARSAEWLTVVDLTGTATEPRPITPKQRPKPAPATTPAPAPAAGADTEEQRDVEALDVHDQDLPEAVWVASLRRLAVAQPAEYLPRLAHALIALSDRLADLARPGEALATADEAVDLAEEVRDRYGANYADTYGWAAYTLGQRLRDIGRDDDATALYAEAVEVFRAEHRHDPYRRAGPLAGVLLDYGGHLLRQRRFAEALDPIQEGLALIRAANEQAPGEFTGQALSYLASLLNSADLCGEELEVGAEAVLASRPVARKHPAQLARLCRALARQASLQYRMRVDGWGLANADEAEALARELAAVNPDVGQRLLVDTIGDALRTYYTSGLADRALAVAEEAVSIARELAQRDPHSVDLLRWALDDYATVLDALDRPEQARAARGEIDRLAEGTTAAAAPAGTSTDDEPEQPVLA
ncbi:MAG TPA: tetratricopeptide repeat protein [Micromonosporaceae bacterium]